MVSAAASTQPVLGRVFLQAADPDARRRAEDFLTRLGCVVCGGEPAGRETPDVIVIVASDGGEAISNHFPNEEYPPPVVVFGAPNGDAPWRRAALEKGAFACLPLDAPPEERACAVLAARRFRAAQIEIMTLRRESDRLCTGLLTSYGEEAMKLRDAQKERQEVQEALDAIRARILRYML
ncbi:MAG: hypothetical protein KIT09_19155 [Bryobacteraceae bacterium]|nr:hypothetical protein [Bryobacteraceae bacterium]